MKPNSAWFANRTDRPQPTGFCVFAPGQVRFLTGGEQNVSRPLLDRAIAKGAIAGPFATEALARSGDKPQAQVTPPAPVLPEGWSEATAETLPEAWTAYTGQTLEPAAVEAPVEAPAAAEVVADAAPVTESAAEIEAPVAEPAVTVVAETKSVFSGDDEEDEEELVKAATKKPAPSGKKR